MADPNPVSDSLLSGGPTPAAAPISTAGRPIFDTPRAAHTVGTCVRCGSPRYRDGRPSILQMRHINRATGFINPTSWHSIRNVAEHVPQRPARVGDRLRAVHDGELTVRYCLSLVGVQQFDLVTVGRVSAESPRRSDSEGWDMTNILIVEGKEELDGTGVSTAAGLDRRRLVDHYVVPVEGGCGMRHFAIQRLDVRNGVERGTVDPASGQVLELGVSWT
jgi:hypothetical protein